MATIPARLQSGSRLVQYCSLVSYPDDLRLLWLRNI